MLWIVLFFAVILLLLVFSFCLTKIAGRNREEDDRQQLLFLETYRRNHLPPSD